MISKKCKYAIKAIIHVARNEGLGKNSNSSQIAEEELIPKKFLESILLQLRNAKFLKSSRGKNGGYSLNIPLSEISILDIIRVIDGPIALLPCVSLNYYSECEDCLADTCLLKSLFETVRNSNIQILSQSLDDLL